MRGGLVFHSIVSKSNPSTIPTTSNNRHGGRGNPTIPSYRLSNNDTPENSTTIPSYRLSNHITTTPQLPTIGMEGVCAKGLARNIGVSNFNAQSVMDLMKYGRVDCIVVYIYVCVSIVGMGVLNIRSPPPRQSHPHNSHKPIKQTNPTQSQVCQDQARRQPDRAAPLPRPRVAGTFWKSGRRRMYILCASLHFFKI